MAPGVKDFILKSKMSINLNKYDVSNNNKSKVRYVSWKPSLDNRYGKLIFVHGQPVVYIVLLSSL